MTQEVKKGLFWFRRDLRLNDNVALYHALKECDTVAAVFVFDKKILENLPIEDKRVEFIWRCIASLKEEFKKLNSDIVVKFANSEEEIPNLAKKFKVSTVYANEDYEPDARQRDGIVADKLKAQEIEFKLYKDQVIFAPNDILNNLGQVFTVFTHYKNAWKKKFQEEKIKTYPVMNFYAKLAKFKSGEMISLEKMGFRDTNLGGMKLEAGTNGAMALFERFKTKVISHYKVLRDIPYVSGVSYLSVHNRFGTISVRHLIHQVKQISASYPENKQEGCELWLDELIWREFYMQLLYHYPRIAYEPFKAEYIDFPWENNIAYFHAWCEGKTGYPLIDAAMKQLNETGYMHNRLRMVVSSFLTKDLLIDYRLGEEYFAMKLLDYDLSANNGGWQWAASTGCDNNAYVRIFNPSKQSEKFDAEGRFIKKYLPQLKEVPIQFLHEPWNYKKELADFGIQLGVDYPNRIVNHEERRLLAIKTYESVNNLK